MTVLVIQTLSIALARGQQDVGKRIHHVQDTTYMYVIRPDDVAEEKPMIAETLFPQAVSGRQEHKETLPRFELRISAFVSQGLRDVSDTNANMHLEFLGNYTKNVAIGLGTGYYHSVGQYATRYLPLMALVDVKSNSYLGFSAFLEIYTGSLLGISNGSSALSGKAPNCFLFGSKVGIAYKLGKSFGIHAGLNYFHVADNKSAMCGDTAESCFGLTGGLSYYLK